MLLLALLITGLYTKILVHSNIKTVLNGRLTFSEYRCGHVFLRVYSVRLMPLWGYIWGYVLFLYSTYPLFKWGVDDCFVDACSTILVFQKVSKA